MSPTLTASEEVLLAALKLSNNTQKEFTEWDLTVKTWELNRNRWGLKNYENFYPDHKRVMNEVMAKGTKKVVGRGWLERTKPNHYKLTLLGLAKAQTFSGIIVTSDARSAANYDAVAPFVNNSIFERFCIDQNEPKTWLGVAAFLNLKAYSADVLDKKLQEIHTAIDSAIDWIKNNQQQVLMRGDSSSTKPISKEKLLKLKKFLSVIETRFKAQFEAIRAKK